MYRRNNEETLARARFAQACNFSLQYAVANAAYFEPGSSPSKAQPAFCSSPNP
jgi:hypothetical protein